MTDSIADMLTRIRNGYAARQKRGVMPHSKIKETIARLLLGENFLEKLEVKTIGPWRQLELTLKYVGKQPVVHSIKRVSRSGRRVYVSTRDLPSPLSGYGKAIISTSKGIMLHTQARREGLGGEVICEVW